MDNSKGRRKRKTKKKNKLKRFILLLFFILIFIIGFGAMYIYNILGNINNENLSKSDADLGISSNFHGEKGITNILLLGVDSRSDDYTGRSDAMIILTIDRVHDKLKLTSLMRDSYVDIEGHGSDKLTHAYAFGGASLAVKTVNQNFNLDIKDYVVVDFAGLADMIDAIGGITLTITDEELPSLNNSIKEQSRLRGVEPKYINSPGTYEVNGIQGVAYARIRKATGGDFKRTERQRIVLEAMFQKVKNAGVFKFPSLVTRLLPHVRTSLSSNSILKLGTSALLSDIGNIEQQRFPLDNYSWGGYIGSGWYLQFNKAITQEQIYNYIYKDISPE